jgi:hypothetical protein
LIVMLCPAIVTVPERELVLWFCANAAVTETAVAPLAGDTPIQVESLTVADHDPPLHPLGLTLTVNVVEPPLAEIVATDVGVTENVQGGGAGRLMLNPSELCAVLLPESRTVHTAV